MQCAECGAAGAACRERFDEFLALEFTDPGYFAVHHLTVAAFMLQHSSRLSREGWLYQREQLRAFLVENIPPDAVGRRTRQRMDRGARNFNFTSRNGLAVIPTLAWRKTILNVRSDNADIYVRDIAAWAKTAFEEALELTV